MSGRVLVFGAGGQLGRALLRRCREPNHVVGLARADADICKSQEVRRALRAHRPHFVVNCAAYTAVDLAETERELAFAVNEDGARILAEESAAADAALIHISTDYVFDGRADRPYGEDAPANPLNVYGESKLAGEAAIQRKAGQHLIIRTGWLFGPSGRNFATAILRQVMDGTPLAVVDDQTGTPTYVDDLALALTAAMRTLQTSVFGSWGTYHFAGSDVVSWYQFACMIRDQADPKRTTPKPRRTNTSEFTRPAPRPRYSALDSSRFRRTFGIPPRALGDAISECIATHSCLQK